MRYEKPSGEAREWILGKMSSLLKVNTEGTTSSVRFLEMSSHFVTMRNATLLRLSEGKRWEETGSLMTEPLKAE